MNIFLKYPENYKIFVPAGTVEIYKHPRAGRIQRSYLEVNITMMTKAKLLWLMLYGMAKDYPEEIAFVKLLIFRKA